MSLYFVGHRTGKKQSTNISVIFFCRFKPMAYFCYNIKEIKETKLHNTAAKSLYPVLLNNGMTRQNVHE
jgi:hypothetical protein